MLVQRTLADIWSHWSWSQEAKNQPEAVVFVEVSRCCHRKQRPSQNLRCCGRLRSSGVAVEVRFIDWTDMDLMVFYASIHLFLDSVVKLLGGRVS